MKRPLIAAAALMAACVATRASQCDETAAIANCINPEQSEVTPQQVACLRSAATKAQRDMSAAYQERFKNTVVSAKPRLASVQKLWQQSTEANCQFFGSAPGSAAYYICVIQQMNERKQTLETLD